MRRRRRTSGCPGGAPSMGGTRISGSRGSGTVFFSGCSLRCCFCQNYRISAEGFGRDISAARLSEIFLELQEQGAHNINLVNPTHLLPWIVEALDRVQGRLTVPVVYNTGGYDRVESLQMLEGRIQIYLPGSQVQRPASQPAVLRRGRLLCRGDKGY